MDDISRVEYEWHPLANHFPLMDEAELEKFADDIEDNGLLQPIWLYEGKILDGRNRYLACKRTGIKPVFKEYDGSSPATFVWSLNARRRDLTPSQKSMIAAAMMPEIEREVKERKRLLMSQRERNPDGTVRPVQERIPGSVDANGGVQARDIIGDAVGVNGHYVSDANRINKECPELASKVREGLLTIPEAVKVMKLEPKTREKAIQKVGKTSCREAISEARREKRDEDLSRIPVPVDCDRYRILEGDALEMMRTLPSASVSAIITDPPYPKQYLSVWQDMAIEAKRVLKPGGSLLAMSGQSYLPQIIGMLNQNLTYQWVIADVFSGPNTQIWDRKIICGWKPVLWYVNGGFYDGEWTNDVLTGGGADKTHHEWGQPVKDFSFLIERFTKPGDTVLDPFAGAGTTLIAALMNGRRVIGIDNDQAAIKETKARIAEFLDDEQKASKLEKDGDARGN